MINPSEGQLHESRLAEYKEVAQNFRTLTDIRFKLLGFLPFGTALGALSTGWGSKGEISVPLSLFGLAVTLALIVYNERNDQLYDELVARAAELERLVGLPDGNFSHRPGTWLKIRPVPGALTGKFAVTIEHRWPIAIIYRVSTMAWLFMLFSPMFHWIRAEALSLPAVHFSKPLANLLAIITAVAVGQLFFDWFDGQKKDRKKVMRGQAVEAVGRLSALKFSPPQHADLDAWEAIFSNLVRLRGGESKGELETILRQARFYLSENLMRSNMYYPVHSLEPSSDFGEERAAHVIGLLTDLPPRWLRDVHSGRRGSQDESEKAIRAKLSAWIEEINLKGLHLQMKPRKTCLRAVEAALGRFIRHA